MTEPISILKATPAYKNLRDKFADHDRRMNSLYSILNEQGQIVPYRRREAQAKYAREQWLLDIVVKARQLGMSSEIAIDICDHCLWRKNFTSGIIDYTLDDAKLKLQKVRTAYMGTPAVVRETVWLVKDNEEELKWSNGSMCYVGTSHRGGTLNFLHISEFGKIAADKPDVAREIKTGALNTIAPGQKIKIESTAHGTSGEFYDMVQAAEAKQKTGQALSQLDFKLHFFAWWMDPKYAIQHNLAIVSSEMREYFDMLLHKHGISLTPDQKAWYVLKHHTLGRDDMHSEFPSMMEETFYNSMEGTWFKREMQKAREEHRIGHPIPHDPNYLVNTFWDIGLETKNNQNAIWFHQTDGTRHRIIDYYENAGEGIQHYATKVHEIAKERHFTLGKHYGPHDIAHRSWANDAKTRKEIAADLGIEFEVVPRVLDKEDAIEALRKMLALTWFDSEHCARLVECLDSYRKTWSKQLGQWTSVPLHNFACVTGKTEVLTRFGPVRIDNLLETGEVLTPCGWKQYRHPHVTRRNAPVVEVTFEDGLSVRCTPDHLFLTASGWRYAKDLQKGSLIRSSLMRSPNTSMASSIGYGLRTVITGATGFCIARFGRLLSDWSQRAATSIIATASKLTTTLKIWSVSRRRTIYPPLGSIAWPMGGTAVSMILPESALQSGIVPRLGGYGISVTSSASPDIRSGNMKNADALFAGVFSIASFVVKDTFKNIAPNLVAIRHIMRAAQRSVKLLFTSALVSAAAPVFRPMAMENKEISAPKFACNDLRIKSVLPLSQAEDVWCLTVNDPNHWWSLANGAVTHNSNAADAGMCGAVGLKPDGIWLADGSRTRGNKKEVRGSQWAQ